MIVICFFVVLFLMIVAIMQIPPLVKKKNKKDLIAYLVFYSMAVILSMLAVYRIPIPSPLQFVKNMYLPIHSLFRKFFGM